MTNKDPKWRLKDLTFSSDYYREIVDMAEVEIGMPLREYVALHPKEALRYMILCYNALSERSVPAINLSIVEPWINERTKDSRIVEIFVQSPNGRKTRSLEIVLPKDID